MKLLLFSLMAVLAAHNTSGTTLDEAFTQAKVKGPILDSTPPNKLTMKYNGVEADNGNTLYSSDVTHLPDLKFTAKLNKLHTVLIFNFNFQGQLCLTPNTVQFVYVNQNIPGNSVEDGDVRISYEVMPPTSGTVVGIVCEQDKAVEKNVIDQNLTGELDRSCKNVRQYLKDNYCENVTAGNVFKVKNIFSS